MAALEMDATGWLRPLSCKDFLPKWGRVPASAHFFTARKSGPPGPEPHGGGHIARESSLHAGAIAVIRQIVAALQCLGYHEPKSITAARFPGSCTMPHAVGTTLHALDSRRIG